jgi:tetratricopeptide (TPR) repeat protein
MTVKRFYKESELQLLVLKEKSNLEQKELELEYIARLASSPDRIIEQTNLYKQLGEIFFVSASKLKLKDLFKVAIEYIQQALETIELLKSDSLQTSAYLENKADCTIFLGKCSAGLSKFKDSQDQIKKGYLLQKQLVKVDPENELTKLILGYYANDLAVAFTKLKNYKEAVKYFRQVLKLYDEVTYLDQITSYKNHVDANTNLALALLELDQYNKALEQIDDIIISIIPTCLPEGYYPKAMFKLHYILARANFGLKNYLEVKKAVLLTKDFYRLSHIAAPQEQIKELDRILAKSEAELKK